MQNRLNKEKGIMFYKSAIDSLFGKNKNLDLAKSSFEQSRIYFDAIINKEDDEEVNFYLGKTYSQDIPPDYKKAFSYFEKAADQGHRHQLSAAPDSRQSLRRRREDGRRGRTPPDQSRRFRICRP